jgi:hypothetical protein
MFGWLGPGSGLAQEGFFKFWIGSTVSSSDKVVTIELVGTFGLVIDLLCQFPIMSFILAFMSAQALGFILDGKA